MKNRNIEHSDNWATPDEVYRILDEEFSFTFDPCPLNTKGFVTPEEDGLIVDWGDSNYVNPPYSRKLKEAFVEKAIEESSRGKLCVLLLPVSTSTVLFHEKIIPNAKEIRLIKRRIRFKGVNTKGEYVESKAGMHDSMIVVMQGRSDGNPKLTTQEFV